MAPEKADKADKAPTLDELVRLFTELTDRVTGVRRGL